MAQVVKNVRQGALSLGIRRYADGRFGFDYTPPGGEGKRIQVRLHSIEGAEVRARELVGAAEAGRVERFSIDPDEYVEFLQWKAQRRAPAQVPTLVAALLAGKEAKGRTVATVRALRFALEPFAQAFPMPIATLRRDAVEKWMESRKVAPRTWNNILSALVTLHRFARADGFLPSELTPVERIERKTVSHRIGTYSPEEMGRILRVVPQDWLPLVVLGGFCGMRPEEISPEPRAGIFKPALRWEHILWSKGKVDVPAECSKVRRRRFAPLTEPARAFLAPWVGARGLVCPQIDRGRFVREYMGAANVAAKPNGLRHSFASYRLALTNDAPALALVMGNSPAMIFRHYLDMKHEDEAARWFALRPSTKSMEPDRAAALQCTGTAGG